MLGSDRSKRKETGISRTDDDIPHGLGLRQAKRIAKQLGCDAHPIRRTGEWRFSHPLMPNTRTVNARRKDSSRELVAWLRSVAALVRADETAAR